jgi:hypothetical protein
MGLIRALKFHVDEAPIGGLTEKVRPWILHLRQFDVEPLLHCAAGQLDHHEPGRTLQQELQGYVVSLHELPGHELPGLDPAAQHFRHAPSLRDTAARRVRSLRIEHFADRSNALLIEMRNETG